MTSQLYLVRHGQTALNAEGRLRGLADPPLDEIGERQAAAVARALSDIGASLVLSSPLRRAVRTAQIIAEALGIEQRIDARLNDRDYGFWTGHRKSEVLAEWGTVDAAPGVETSETVLTRVLPALDEFAVPGADSTPLIVVTHDAVIRPLMLHIDPDATTITVPTGSYQVLIYLEGRWRIDLIDQQPL
ncbi:histidine phosphatase family protein (plasmid) [Rhodococcus erythropolis]|uniref:Histidine phosphatase family protein n=1 Tax=Rhodococcus qingshengii JCM 15477 TaxID=1303681 RepID=A0AB38RQV4_RHOSG|nr:MULTISPECIES: histidine phosphatase family protein [Rhodococcus]MBY6386606.1 histidine phosphatase family protein [Rhodococcus erythropolis]MBY6388482.1 histidine phosphatase family protein [Rhodococcus erythropolis]MBY6388703.1 histidine phosphatase family protein [Rhodococcus erythropolis]MBY6388986.1 histidine phosphatase family protein [Rhodococcus erythropolis]MBY6389444.1 histidine phosphatase family protein [Rhodococcus erythropolis]